MEQFPRIITFPPIIRTYVIDPTSNIMNTSFNEQETKKTPLCKGFQETLKTYIIKYSLILTIK